MPALYVANLSKQHHQFLFHRRENPQVIPEHIPVGSQIRIGGNLTMDDIEDIIKQHLPYGLKSVKELKRTQSFSGLCYSIDEPVQMDSFDVALEKNDDVLNANAEERRQTAAEAIADSNRKLAGEAGLPLQRTEVETVEDTKGTPTLAVGYERPESGVEPRRGGKRGAARDN